MRRRARSWAGELRTKQTIARAIAANSSSPLREYGDVVVVRDILLFDACVFTVVSIIVDSWFKVRPHFFALTVRRRRERWLPLFRVAAEILKMSNHVRLGGAKPPLKCH